jgi:hypothetical protein
MMLRLDEDRQTFFNDNLRVYAYYMTHLGKALYHYMYAYRHQADTDVLLRHLDFAYIESVRAQQYLFEAQHGEFSTWYSNAEDMSRTFQIDWLKETIRDHQRQALERGND